MRTFLPILVAVALAACDNATDGAAPDQLAAGAPSESPRRSTAPARAASPASPVDTTTPAQATPPPEAKPVPPPDATTDSAITARIQQALSADANMAGADVSIRTDKGVVVLSGVVKSHEQTGIASAHAQKQDGVIRVDNHLAPSFS